VVITNRPTIFKDKHSLKKVRALNLIQAKCHYANGYDQVQDYKYATSPVFPPGSLHISAFKNVFQRMYEIIRTGSINAFSLKPGYK